VTLTLPLIAGYQNKHRLVRCQVPVAQEGAA